MEGPNIRVVTERGEELTPKEIKVDVDAKGAFEITVTIDSADLSDEHTYST